VFFHCVAVTYAYTADLYQYLTDDVYPHTILVSGMQTIGEPSCASFSIFYNFATSFIIRAPACLFTDEDGTLLKTFIPSLGAHWRSVYLPIIPRTSAPCDTQLQFEVVISQNLPGLSIAISDVTVSPGSCLGMCLICLEQQLLRRLKCT
jgi:hypothetical protein